MVNVYSGNLPDNVLKDLEAFRVYNLTMKVNGGLINNNDNEENY